MREQLVKVLEKYAPNSFQIVEDGQSLRVHEVVSGMAEQENYYELEQEGSHFRLNRVSRGQKEVQKTFQREDAAYLALAAVSIEYASKLQKPRPDFSEQLEGFTEAMAEDKELLGPNISSQHYALLAEKKRAVVLEKADGFYHVAYIDPDGQKDYISEDFDIFGDALVVVYNYAWYLELLEQLNRDWQPSLNPENREFEKIAKLLLTI